MTKVNLKSKINEIRYELSKKMNKSGKNDYSKYDYFQLKDFMPQALEMFNDKGIYTEFYISKDKYDLPGKTTISKTFNEDGTIATETEVKEENFEYKEFAHLVAINLDDEDDVIELTKETADVRLQAAQPIQNLGGKTTYMKRYMYMDLLEINENDKVEEETGKPVKVETKTTKKASKPVVSTVSSTPQTVEPEPAPAPASEQVATDELMSMETKIELANKITELGGDPRKDIIEIAKELGTDVPLLKESDKDMILNMIENRLN